MSRLWICAIGFLWLSLATTCVADESLILVVMDPLAKELSCPCVKGYAQRDYKKLGKYLEQQVQRPIKVVFMDSLKEGLEREDLDGADLIIGKHSVVLAQSRAFDMPAEPLAALSGKTGLTTQQGLIVVGFADPAKSVADLQEHEVIFGTEDCDEKYAAALKLFAKAKVKLPETLETCASCADGATKIVEAGPGAKIATVISSYAAPLLEGCGTVKKGDLKILAKTDPVPFITAFATPRVTEKLRNQLRDALLNVGEHAALCKEIETLNGFVEFNEEDAKSDEAVEDQAAEGAADVSNWTGWRGPRRDAQVRWLPDELPAKVEWVWKKRLASPGLGGLAATRNFVIVSGREAGDTTDFFGA